MPPGSILSFPPCWCYSRHTVQKCNDVHTIHRNNRQLIQNLLQQRKRQTSSSLYLIKHHALKTYGAEWRHNFIILGLITTWKWMVSFALRPLYLQLPVPIVVGTGSRSACFGQESNLLPLTGIEPRFISHPFIFFLVWDNKPMRPNASWILWFRNPIYRYPPKRPAHGIGMYQRLYEQKTTQRQKKKCRETSRFQVVFEPTIPMFESHSIVRAQDHTAIVIGKLTIRYGRCYFRAVFA
jgi:hypothetical protein